MRLKDWMKQNRYTDAAFITEINKLLDRPYTWRAVQPWRTGVCVPRPPVVAAINQFTKGKVTYQDHVDAVKDAGFRTRHIPPAVNGAA